MISRGEVGLIVTAMGASSGIFGQPEVAVMVTVVLLTTLLTPLIMRGAFLLRCPEDEAADNPNLSSPDEEPKAHAASILEMRAEA